MSKVDGSSENIEIEAKTVSIEVVAGNDDTSEQVRTERIVFYGSVNTESVSEVIKRIINVNDENTAERIELYLVTGGGVIDSGLGLYDVIKMSPIPIDTVAVGRTMSMGITLLQAGVKRYAMKNATLMTHRAKGGAYGTSEDVEVDLKELKRLERLTTKLVSGRIGMTPEEYMEFMGNIDVFMTAKKALKHNFIDGIKKTW